MGSLVVRGRYYRTLRMSSYNLRAASQETPEANTAGRCENVSRLVPLGLLNNLYEKSRRDPEKTGRNANTARNMGTPLRNAEAGRRRKPRKTRKKRKSEKNRAKTRRL